MLYIKLLGIIIGCIIIPAAANAFMDRIVFDFSTSIARKWNKDFWDPAGAWMEAKRIKIIGYPLDGWHIAKTVFLLFIMIPNSLYLKSQLPITHRWYDAAIYMVILGLLWSISFSIFFNRVFKRKNQG